VSDAEEERYPVPISFRRIKAEPEVSCVTVSMLNGFHKYGYESVKNTSFTMSRKK
jgi:hypothetical protein